MSAEGLEDLQGKIWDQVWAHSRHLESMRSQYLGFFFTAALAVAAIAAKDLAADGLTTSGSLIAFSALMLGLVVLSASLLIAVSRINDVLARYGRLVFEIRDASSERDSGWAQLPGPSGSYLGSTHGAAESVLYASLVVFVAALLAGAIRSHVVGDLTSLVCWLGLALGLIPLGICVSKVGLPGRSRA